MFRQQASQDGRRVNLGRVNEHNTPLLQLRVRHIERYSTFTNAQGRSSGRHMPIILICEKGFIRQRTYWIKKVAVGGSAFPV